MALEATAALIGLFTVVPLIGRFRESGSAADLGLAAAMAFLVFANFCYSVVPLASGLTPDYRFTTWAALLCRLLGAALFAVSSFLPTTGLARPQLVVRRVAAGLFVLLVVIGLSVRMFRDHLPAGLNPPPLTSVAPSFDVPVISALQVFALAFYGLAALGLARRSRRSGDELYAWLSVGMALACCAALNYVLYPSLYSNWLYTGDGFRLAGGLALLTGAVREIRRYWLEATKLAVLEERRRIARDLHDGIAQELAFIGRRARRLDADGSQPIQAAADRALAEARRTLAILSRPLDEPLTQVLAYTVEVAGARGSTPVELRMDESIVVTPEVREVLTMIAREAVTNAARHAEASVIVVEVSRGPETTLLVRDDGRGFHADEPVRGFGIQIMRDRAAAVGAAFRLATEPGRGTTVEVTLQ